LQNRNKHKFYINILNFCAKFERSSFKIRLYAKISDFLPIVHCTAQNIYNTKWSEKRWAPIKYFLS